MPNYVRTRISFVGDKKQVDELKKFVKGEYKKDNGETRVVEFDFRKIIPIPEDLMISSSSAGDCGMCYLILNDKSSFAWTNDDRSFMERMENDKKEKPEFFNECIELGKKYLANISKYGYKDWYSFCINNWGTKWNACNPEWISDDQVEFDTAWSFCYKVIKKLSEIFPEIIIEFEYADEDLGSNAAVGSFKNGEEINCEFPDDCSNRAYEIALSLHPQYQDQLVYDDASDTYKWVEDKLEEEL